MGSTVDDVSKAAVVADVVARVSVRDFVLVKDGGFVTSFVRNHVSVRS